MADRHQTAKHLWDKSPKHRGKRLAIWAKDGKTRKERKWRWQAARDVARNHADFAKARRQWRFWRAYHPLAQWFSKVTKRIKRRIRRRHHQNEGGIGGVNVTSTASGDPHWGGGGDVMAQFVIPFMRARGLGWSSHKRTPAQNAAVGGSSTSDHLTTHTTTDAYDFPTYSGEDEARELARAFGISSWQANSYAQYDVTIDGHAFRVQILWGAAIGHGDHVHVGIGQA